MLTTESGKRSKHTKRAKHTKDTVSRIFGSSTGDARAVTTPSHGPDVYSKHKPTIFYNSVTSVPTHFALHHNFNDFAADIVAVHDAQYARSISQRHYSQTLIFLTFGATEIYTVDYRMLALLREGSLKRLLFVAYATGHTNLDTALADIPPTNTTGIIPGPFNVQYYVPITAPNTSAIGAGSGAVFVVSGLDTSFTAASAPALVSLTVQGETVAWLGPCVVAASSNSSSSSGNGVTGAREGILDAKVLGALLAGLVMHLLA
ncbi:hypothetical protein EDB87DRAFT_1832298 [Lactarius vividus]|nr:hypothetical protein EDB87DRAFT_1832298 [Lactarius vividus]